MTPAAVSTTAKISSAVRSISDLFDHHGGAVGDDFAHGLGDFGGVEAHHDDGVAAHQAGVLDHAVEGVAAGLLQQGGVFGDLATENGTQAGEEVAGQAAAADDDAEDLALAFNDAMTGDLFCGGDQHGEPLMRWDVSTMKAPASGHAYVPTGSSRNI